MELRKYSGFKIASFVFRDIFLYLFGSKVIKTKNTKTFKVFDLKNCDQIGLN